MKFIYDIGIDTINNNGTETIDSYECVNKAIEEATNYKVKNPEHEVWIDRWIFNNEEYDIDDFFKEIKIDS